MRLIDADAMQRQAFEDNFAGRISDGMLFAVNWLLERAPTIDAVQVIRCKDCRYYDVYERKYDGSADKRFKPSICIRAYEYAVAKAPNWFCADAEPKEKEQ